jgi:hypothetical protein
MSPTDESLYDLPSHFYKYRSLDSEDNFNRVKEIVTQNKIYCSSPKSLNDPFDCRPSLDFRASKREMRDELNRLQKLIRPGMNRKARRKSRDEMFDDPVWNPRTETAKARFQELYDLEMNRNGVLCMSARNDDILMWAHYADSHRGVCLEFTSISPLMSLAQRVHYSETRPIISQYTNVDKAISFERAMLTKSEHWCYEKEWRIIRNEEGFGHAKFQSKDLTGIIFGLQCQPDMVQRFREMLKDRASPISLYRAEINKKNYKISIVPL